MAANDSRDGEGGGEGWAPRHHDAGAGHALAVELEGAAAPRAIGSRATHE
jgi:hypothetical protein